MPHASSATMNPMPDHPGDRCGVISIREATFPDGYCPVDGRGRVLKESCTVNDPRLAFPTAAFMNTMALSMRYVSREADVLNGASSRQANAGCVTYPGANWDDSIALFT